MTVLEKGQPPQILRGVEDKLEDSRVSDRNSSKKNGKGVVATGDKAVGMTPPKPLGLASKVPFQTDKASTKPVASKREWRNISVY